MNIGVYREAAEHCEFCGRTSSSAQKLIFGSLGSTIAAPERRA